MRIDYSNSIKFIGSSSNYVIFRQKGNTAVIMHLRLINVSTSKCFGKFYSNLRDINIALHIFQRSLDFSFELLLSVLDNDF